MLNKPIITWHILEELDDEFIYVPKKKHEEEESYTTGDTMTIKLQVWNNKGGKEDVRDITDAKLIIYFKNFEDNFFLKLMSIKKENGEFEKLNIDIDRAYFDLGRIAGKANNGTEMNTDNFYNLEIKLGPMPKNIRSELKDIIIDMDYNDEE